MGELAGRRVLITGAARGIGAALAERLHQRGARVALAGLEVGVRALERGIAGRRRWIVAPAWVGAVLPVRMAAQVVVERATQRGLSKALAIARDERVDLTTPQPERARR